MRLLKIENSEISEGRDSAGILTLLIFLSEHHPRLGIPPVPGWSEAEAAAQGMPTIWRMRALGSGRMGGKEGAGDEGASKRRSRPWPTALAFSPWRVFRESARGSVAVWGKKGNKNCRREPFDHIHASRHKALTNFLIALHFLIVSKCAVGCSGQTSSCEA